MKKGAKHIAGRKRVERSSRAAAQDQFKAIFNHAPCGILLADLETKKFDAANKKICRMLGYSLEEIKKMRVMDIHPEKDLPYVTKQFERQARGDFTLSKDLPVQRKDGGVFYTDINSVAITVAGKKYLAGFFHDTTRRKQMEETLWKSAERHRQIIETTQEGFGEIDAALRIVSANKRCAEMFGYTLNEFIGLHMVEDLVAPTDRKNTLEQMKRRRRGKTGAYEQRFRRKDGKAVWAIISATPIKDQSGAVRGSFAMITDITKRKQAEEALLFKAVLLEAQAETSVDGILAVDNEGHSILFNKRFGEIWKIPRRILDTKDDARMLKFVSKQLKDPTEFNRKVAYLYKHKNEKSHDEIEFTDGRCLDRYSAPLITGHGEHQGRIWYFHDITKRRQVENEVRKLNESLEKRVQARTTELSRANHEQEILIRIMSHDLRAPLVNIQGFTQLLNKACNAITRILAAADMPDETRQTIVASHEKAEKSIRFINAGVEKMNSLIGGLLRLSQLGRVPLALQTLDMNALLQTVVESIAFQIRTTAAEVTVDVLPDCQADAALISQVFANLLDNAVKYRDPARPLRVRVWGRRPGVGHREKDARTVYCVEDNGLGVAPEHQQRIWDLFYRLNPQKSGAGEGVGLTVVQRIVERHGGKVWLKSDIGKGSRFFLALPAAAKETEP